MYINQYCLLLTQYHQVPTSTTPYWPGTTKYQPVKTYTVVAWGSGVLSVPWWCVSLTLMVCLSTVSSSWRRVKPRLPHTLVRLIVNCPTADLCKFGSGGRLQLLQIWMRWPFTIFAILEQVAVYNFCKFGWGGPLQLLQIWMRWPFSSFSSGKIFTLSCEGLSPQVGVGTLWSPPRGSTPCKLASAAGLWQTSIFSDVFLDDMQSIIRVKWLPGAWWGGGGGRHFDVHPVLWEAPSYVVLLHVVVLLQAVLDQGAGVVLVQGEHGVVGQGRAVGPRLLLPGRVAANHRAPRSWRALTGPGGWWRLWYSANLSKTICQGVSGDF